MCIGVADCIVERKSLRKFDSCFGGVAYGVSEKIGGVDDIACVDALWLVFEARRQSKCLTEVFLVQSQ